MVVAGAIFAASVVYMVAGFGFALLAMPVMTLTIPVEQAVVVSSLLALASTTWQGWTLRGDAVRPLVRRLTASAYVGMPLGLVVLFVVDDRVLRVALGVGVLIATALLVRRISVVPIGRRLDVAMGFVSGVANTSIGTNGPPLVFDLQARDLTPDQFRATISAVFALSNVLAFSLFVVSGKVTGDGLTAAAIAFPAWAAGLALGRSLRPRVPPERFRHLVLGLLFTAGTTTIVLAVT